jgi:flagellar biosynthesis chaperone FliJ
VLKLLLAGITTPSQPSHTHLYTKRIINPTCTQHGYSIYTCSCGDTYSTDYVEPAHNYKNNVCTVCGNNENYNLYLTEYNELTADYNAKVSELEAKIAKCNENIENCQKAINDARGTLATLSPSCPQWFLQEYINNWQAYGSTGAATQAAQNAWRQQYNSQISQLNNTISTNNSIIQTEQQNIRLYTSAITTLTTQYNNNVTSLKLKYGID